MTSQGRDVKLFTVVLLQTRAWVLSLGFTLAYGSMFSKVWTIYRLTTRRKKEIKVRDATARDKDPTRPCSIRRTYAPNSVSELYRIESVPAQVEGPWYVQRQSVNTGFLWLTPLLLQSGWAACCCAAQRLST